MLCPNCKKQEVFPDTWREKLANWFVHHITPKTLKDERTDARMEGFSEGYRLSGKVGQELQQMSYQQVRIEEQISQLVLMLAKDMFPHV